jgi:hypothetical protein
VRVCIVAAAGLLAAVISAVLFGGLSVLPGLLGVVAGVAAFVFVETQGRLPQERQ